jgi:hypothetical protein
LASAICRSALARCSRSRSRSAMVSIHTHFADLGPYPGDFGMRDNPVMICVFTIGEIGR